MKTIEYKKEIVPYIAEVYTVAWAFLVAQTVKNLPAMQETSVRFLGGEHLPEKGKMLSKYLLNK